VRGVWGSRCDMFCWCFIGFCLVFEEFFWFFGFLVFWFFGFLVFCCCCHCLVFVVVALLCCCLVSVCCLLSLVLGLLVFF